MGILGAEGRKLGQAYSTHHEYKACYFPVPLPVQPPKGIVNSVEATIVYNLELLRVKWLVCFLLLVQTVQE
jgi:hypothetical protein